MAISRFDGATSVTSRVADQDAAAGDALQPRDHAQHGRLAAAGGADEDDELAMRDVEVDAVDDLDVAEGLGDIVEVKRAIFYPLTAPMVMPLMKYRWKNRKTTSVGRLAISDSAP